MAEIAKGEVNIEVNLAKFQQDLKRAEQEFQSSMRRMTGSASISGGSGLGSSPGLGSTTIVPFISGNISSSHMMNSNNVTNNINRMRTISPMSQGSPQALPQTFPSGMIDSGWVGAGVVGASRGWLGSGGAPIVMSAHMSSSGGTFVKSNAGQAELEKAYLAEQKRRYEGYKGGGPGSGGTNFSGPGTNMNLYSGIPVGEMIGALGGAAKGVARGVAWGWNKANTPIPYTPKIPGAMLAFASIGSGISAINNQSRIDALGASMGMATTSEMQAEIADQIIEANRSGMGGLVGTTDDIRDRAAGRKIASVEIAERRGARALQSASNNRAIALSNTNQQASMVGLRGLTSQIADIDFQTQSQNRQLLLDPNNNNLVNANNILGERRKEEARFLFNRDQGQQVMTVNTQIKQNELFRKGAFQQATELGINDQYRVRIDNAKFNEQNDLAAALSKLRDSEIERSRFISPRNINQIDYYRTSTGGVQDTRSPNVDPPRASQIATLIEIMRNGFATLTTMSGTGTISVPVAQ